MLHGVFKETHTHAHSNNPGQDYCCILHVCLKEVKWLSQGHVLKSRDGGVNGSCSVCYNQGLWSHLRLSENPPHFRKFSSSSNISDYVFPAAIYLDPSWYFNVWPPVDGTVWKYSRTFRTQTLLQEVRHWSGFWEFIASPHFQFALFVSCVCGRSDFSVPVTCCHISLCDSLFFPLEP